MKNKNIWKCGFIQRLKFISEENVAAFARKAKISDQAFRSYLDGTIPGADKLIGIARAGNISLEKLITGKDLPPDTELIINAVESLKPHIKSSPDPGSNPTLDMIYSEAAALDSDDQFTLLRIIIRMKNTVGKTASDLFTLEIKRILEKINAK